MHFINATLKAASSLSQLLIVVHLDILQFFTVPHDASKSSFV
jgi:hypothetical protein